MGGEDTRIEVAQLWEKAALLAWKSCAGRMVCSSYVLYTWKLHIDLIIIIYENYVVTTVASANDDDTGVNTPPNLHIISSSFTINYSESIVKDKITFGPPSTDL